MITSPLVRLGFVVAMLTPQTAAASLARELSQDTIRIKLKCARCEIKLSYVATLGRAAGAASPTRYSEVVRDRRGRFLVAPTYSPGEIAVFGPNGRFLSTIGRKGSGPGEFQSINTLSKGAGDSIVVVDRGTARISILSPDGKFVRSLGIGAPVYDAALLPGGRIAVQTRNTNRQERSPITIYDSKNYVVKFFGADRSESRYYSGVREFDVRGNTLWSAYVNKYQIDIFDLSNGLRRRLVRNATWFRPFSERDIRRLAKSPPTQTVDMRLASSTLAIVVFDVFNKGYQFPPRPKVMTEEHLGVTPLREMNKMFDSVIEAVDESGNVLARRRFTKLLIKGFVDPAHVFSIREDDRGVVLVDIWKVVLP